MTSDTDRKPTRRDQQRQATLDEIVDTARRMLVHSRDISLRQVAQEVGMTPPALYRYVESVEDLTLKVAAQVYDELLAHLHEVAAPYEPDPARQLVAAAAAFRNWGLAHVAEFGLTFANPVTSIAAVHEADRATADAAGSGCAAPVGTEMHEAGERFGGYFAMLVLAVWEEHGFPSGEAPPIAQDDAIASSLQQKFGDDTVPEAAAWALVRCWSRLYGTTTLEVLGHVDPVLVANAALFLDMVGECSAILGLDHRRDELRGVVMTVLAA